MRDLVTEDGTRATRDFHGEHARNNGFRWRDWWQTTIIGPPGRYSRDSARQQRRTRSLSWSVVILSQRILVGFLPTTNVTLGLYGLASTRFYLMLLSVSFSVSPWYAELDITQNRDRDGPCRIRTNDHSVSPSTTNPCGGTVDPQFHYEPSARTTELRARDRLAGECSGAYGINSLYRPSWATATVLRLRFHQDSHALIVKAAHSSSNTSLTSSARSPASMCW